jgi:hypothetical protein
MEITSVQFFEAIRAFNWRQLQEWFDDHVKVSYPHTSTFSIFNLDASPQYRRNPADINDYVGWGLTKGKHSPVEALFLKKHSMFNFSDHCVTEYSKDFYSTYAILVYYGAYSLTEHGSYGKSCLDGSKNNRLLQAVDSVVLCNKRGKTQSMYRCNSIDYNTIKRSLDQSVASLLLSYTSNSQSPQYGGRRTRNRRLRRTRRR